MATNQTRIISDEEPLIPLQIHWKRSWTTTRCLWYSKIASGNSPHQKPVLIGKELGDFPAMELPRHPVGEAARQGQLKLLSPGFEPQDRDSPGGQAMLGTWESNQEEWWYHGYITNDDCWLVIKAQICPFLLSIQLNWEDYTHWHPLTPIDTHWHPLTTILPFYLSTYLPIYLCTCVPIYLSPYLPIYISTYLHIYLSTYLPIYLSFFLSFFLSFLPLSLSLYFSGGYGSTTPNISHSHQGLVFGSDPPGNPATPGGS